MVNGEPDTTPPEVEAYLAGVEYPASRDDLIENARSEGAERDVLARLEALEDREYSSPTDVAQALGE